jgi:hypothetical protein
VLSQCQRVVVVVIVVVDINSLFLLLDCGV